MVIAQFLLILLLLDSILALCGPYVLFQVLHNDVAFADITELSLAAAKVLVLVELLKRELLLAILALYWLSSAHSFVVFHFLRLIGVCLAILTTDLLKSFKCAKLTS